MVPIPVQDLRVYYVNDLEDACPKYLKEDKLTLRELQALCDKWEVKVSGTKEEVRDRLVRFFAGQAVVQKGYSKLYVQLRERELPSSRDMPLAPRPNYKAPPTALAKAKASTSTASSTPTSGRGYAAGAKDRGKAVTEMMMGNEDCLSAHCRALGGDTQEGSKDWHCSSRRARGWKATCRNCLRFLWPPYGASSSLVGLKPLL